MRTWLTGVMVASIAFCAPKPAEACSPPIPRLEQFDLGPTEIPLEGVIVIFIGQHSTLLPVDVTVTTNATPVLGTVEQYVGSTQTGDLIVWIADAPLTAGASYDVTIQFFNMTVTATKTAALAAAAAPAAPTITNLLLTERAKDSALCCDAEDSCGGCRAVQFDYVPAFYVSWHEPTNGLDRRYLRYRWLIGQPDGTFAPAFAEGTTLMTENGSEFYVTGEANNYCLALETTNLIDGRTARSADACRARTELVTVPHTQPDSTCAMDPIDPVTGDPVTIDGGCQSSRGAPSWVLVLALAFLRRRRRQRNSPRRSPGGSLQRS